MKKRLGFLGSEQKRANVLMYVCVLAAVVALVWGLSLDPHPVHMTEDDGIERIDLDTVYLKASGVEVNFSEVILSEHDETRKLIVSTQRGTAKTELTDRLIKQLDFDFLKKTQSVSCVGTGYFVVDLDNLSAANIVQDKDKKTVTIRIDHPYLEAIEIHPDQIMIDEVREGLLARGDIELTVKDYNAIEKELRTQLEDKFDTVANGQAADALALEMVKEIYEPIVKAVDRKYDVIVAYR